MYTDCFLLRIYRKILACSKPLHTQRIGGMQLEILMVEENMQFSNNMLKLVGCYSFGRLELDSKIPVSVFKGKATDVDEYCLREVGI